MADSPFYAEVAAMSATSLDHAATRDDHSGHSGIGCGLGHDGGLAEYVVVPESHLAEIPEGLSFEEAAAVPIAA